ncbi:hypothetical protein QQS45_08285 [Alteriqipengyuania flavescens]|uniref:DNA-directed RNA polymerase n=1 Tax=Alteriqipengyuania flavescens TaxID=3053610 RepID=UPI0025B39567|nr:DNA-directed RNA polymerase [Alteriqipengyuania flavescens]WJY17645.1 hypothetical protein QQW98_08280 [Alteriqipengyuania flavescens]WJY23588.1 hypothetical protein QQS45_08285 [Alteriqipengyuania flavescens]
MNDLRDRIRRQLELEDESRALGARRYANRDLPWRFEAGTAEEEANLPPGKQLLKAALQPTADAIRGFIDGACSGKAGRKHSAADMLLLIEPMEAAYLTCRVLVNASVAQVQLQRIAVQVSDAIDDHLSLSGFREINRQGYKGFLKSQEQRGYTRQRRAAVRSLLTEEGVLVETSTSQKVARGTKLVELAVEATGLWTIEKAPRARGFAYTIRPSETLQDWLDKQHARCSLLDPIHLPMLVRPRRWRSPSYGGYLTPRPGNRLVKQRNKPYHEELRNILMDDVYDAVNHIQDTPWRINARILDLMTQVWDGGGCLGGLPQREDDPVPAKPDDIDFNEDAKAAWKREAAATHSRNAERISGRVAIQQGLWVARRFAEEPAIYFPHELDFRGRVYPIPSFGPSPQGSDWQKALIEFADGKPLGTDGRRWLYIHIANLFGVDKVSFDERVEWTLSHAPQLLDSAMNPLDGERFWTSADDPWMALAACMEFEGALDQGADFVSRLPIALDGSCSGLQHFSAMLRDHDGGAAVNLLPCDSPADIYTMVAARAQEVAETETLIEVPDPADPAGTIRIPNPWRGGKVSRKIAKRPTMTYCYSATRFGMQGMIVETLREIDREAEARGGEPYLGGADNYHAATWLSHVLYRAVGDTVTAAEQAMGWLRDAAAVASQEGLPLWWTTPLGLPILQEYRRQKGERVEVHWAGRRVRMTINVDVEALDNRAQANGVAPNFIHSLDAAHLQAVALRCRREGIAHLAVIHDSFGTHAADTGRIGEILRETFVEQYSGDVLKDLYRELVGQLGDDLAKRLPEPPAMGDLDLSQVKLAQYTFA